VTRRYRRRGLRRMFRRLTRRQRQALAAIVAIVAVVMIAGHGGSGSSSAAAAGAPPSGAAAQIIAYAQAQEGCPYVWGGTGPCSSGYDCSGLTMQAYASAGITIPRTAAEQWAAGPQVTDPQPGDLVFFVGADGTWSAPGHVAIYVGPNQLIDAYATGWNVQQQSFGLPSSWEGLGDPVGYTDPMEGS
jgi:cell wall-associated NlpC family hydrolase